MVDPFAQSQQKPPVSVDNEHIDTQPAFGGSVDAFDAMSVGPYQPAPLSEDPFAIPEESHDSHVVDETLDPFVRMWQEESAPIAAPFSEVTAPEETAALDPFIVGDNFSHTIPEATVVEEVAPVTQEAISVEEVPVVKSHPTPKKESGQRADPVTVVEPPLETEDVSTEPVVDEEREAEPTKDVSPLLQKLAILVHNIRTILAEDDSLVDGISLIGGNSGVSHVEYIAHLDDDETGVWIDKKETAHNDGSESEHALHFYNAGDALVVRVNDVELFHEKELHDNPADTMQISEKINKFIFLTDNYISDMRKKNAAKASEHDALEAFQQF